MTGSDQDLRRKVEELERELIEAHQREAATAEVLGAISRSKIDLQPVLDTLVASAAHLCDAQMVAIHLRHDNTFAGRARYGVPAEMVEALSRIGEVMGRGSAVGRTIAEGRPVHIPDATADPEYTNRDFTRITGARSTLGVPLLRDAKPVGLLSLYRTRVAPFTARQIELIETFAHQAVIAIENTRLFEAEQARTGTDGGAGVADSDRGSTQRHQPFAPSFNPCSTRSSRQRAPVRGGVRPRYLGGGWQYTWPPEQRELAFVKYASGHPLPPGRGSLRAGPQSNSHPVHLPDA